MAGRLVLFYGRLAVCCQSGFSIQSRLLPLIFRQIDLVKRVAKSDCVDVLAFVVIDDFRIDEEAHGHQYSFAGMQNLLYEAKAFDFVEKRTGLVGRNIVGCLPCEYSCLSLQRTAPLPTGMR